MITLWRAVRNQFSYWGIEEEQPDIGFTPLMERSMQVILNKIHYREYIDIQWSEKAKEWNERKSWRSIGDVPNNGSSNGVRVITVQQHIQITTICLVPQLYLILV